MSSAALLVVLAALAPPPHTKVVTRDTAVATVRIGTAVLVLAGPWRFRTGDDPAWADPAYDDTGWESVSLAAPPGAHDADVGLTGYAPGWTALGHAGYSGYAWYRLRLRLSWPPGDTLALSGPPDVDDAYQVFVNGHLLGGIGDFSVSPPVAYSIQPRAFRFPASRLAGPPNGADGTVVLAFRVWMAAGSLQGGPDVGGIHIAPALGAASAIAARYRRQWIETVRGYAVEVVEAALFVALAGLVAGLVIFRRAPPSLLWLGLAMVLTAAVRANQAVFYWTQVESVPAGDLLIGVFLVPLGLGAWAMALQARLAPGLARWLPPLAGGLTVALVAAEFLGRAGPASYAPHVYTSGARHVAAWIRVAFAILMGYAAVAAARRGEPDRWLALTAALLIGVGLFAAELSALHVPGIWFPFGTGVSRTQFAYAGFDLVLFAWLVRRAARRPIPTSTTEPR